MKFRSASLIDLVHWSLFASAAVAFAAGLGREPASAIEVSPDADGYITLFDGRSLNGWHKNPKPIGHGTGGDWQVVDGILTGQQDPPGSGNGGILLTDDEFGDCELLIEMRPDWGIDSGVFIRSNDQGQCYQMMVDYHEAGNVGHIFGEGTGGFNNRPFEILGVYDAQKHLIGLKTRASGLEFSPDKSITGADWVKHWKLNDWNAAKVRVVGNPPEITTWINGELVSHFDGQTFRGPGYDRSAVINTPGAKGHIAVQVHGGRSWPKGAQCRWRNIRIKPL